MYSYITGRSVLISEITPSLLDEVLTVPKEPIKPLYTFERIWQKKWEPSFTPYVEYIDGKSYYEYPLGSYIRTNWKQIEEDIKSYSEKLNDYNLNMKTFETNLRLAMKYNLKLNHNEET